MITLDIEQADCTQTPDGKYECDVKVSFNPSEIVVEPPLPEEPPPVKPPPKPPTTGDYIYHLDFDDVPKGNLTLSDINSLFGAHGGRLTSKAEIVDDPANSGRGNVFRIFHEKGTSGRKGGGQWMARIPPGNDYYFAYDLFVEEGFNFPLSTKLPGLYGGDLREIGPKDNERMTGLVGYSVFQGMVSDRRPGDTAGYTNVGDGSLGASTYTYHKAQKKRWYEDENGLVRLTPGRWGTLEQRVKMNTGSNKDGLYQVWFNGKKVYDTKLTYVITDKIKTDGIFFVHWYGGNPPAFNAREDQWTYFDNYRVSTTPITH